MKMRVIKSVGVSDRRDLLAAPHALTALHHDFVEMPIKRIDVSRPDSVAIRVPHDDNVPPALMTIARKNNNAVADALNRIAQIGVAAANSIPIFSQMSVRTKAARPIITARVRFTDRHVESIRQSDKCGLS